MKNLKKTRGWLVMAAALTVGLSACSGSEDAIEQTTPESPATQKTYTLTVTATKSTDDATTRALSLDGKTLNATWKTGETVDVYQPKKTLKLGTISDYHYYIEKVGTLTAQTSGTTATLSGTVTLSEKTNLELYYGSPSYDYSGQVGTIDDISAHYNYATVILYKSKYELEDGKITLVNPETPLNFANKQAIVKFTLKDTDGHDLKTQSLIVGTTGNHKYNVARSIATATSEDIFTRQTSFTVTTTEATNVFYVAMPEISSNSAFPIHLEVTEKTDVEAEQRSYFYDRADVTFTKGKYYEVTVKMKRIVDLSKLTANYTARPGDVLTGELPSGKHLSIADGVSVTLSDATISDASQAGITCLGSATITLEGTNNVASTHYRYPGIQAGGSTTTLTITGDGSLTATGGDDGAGIGSGSGATCGNITITGGNITAIGGEYGAGIGSGSEYRATPAVCGDITITGGTGSATGGSKASWDIGSGYNSSCGTINVAAETISGLNEATTATVCFRVKCALYDNQWVYDYNVSFECDVIKASIEGIQHIFYAFGEFTQDSPVTIKLPPVNNATLHFKDCSEAYDHYRTEVTLIQNTIYDWDTIVLGQFIND